MSEHKVREKEKDEIQAIRDEILARAEKSLEKDMWVIATYPGNRFLGVVKEVYSKASRLISEPVAIKKEDVLGMFALGGLVLGLNPIFEYILSLQATPEGHMAKNPTILPLDMGGDNAISYIHPNQITFIEDIQEANKQVYKELIANGLATIGNTKVVDRSDVKGNNDGPRILSPMMGAGLPPGVNLPGMRRRG